MKIKVPEIKPKKPSLSDQLFEVEKEFELYLRRCEEAKIPVEVFVQQTADSLAWILVRMHDDTQALCTMMNLIINRAAVSAPRKKSKKVSKK